LEYARISADRHIDAWWLPPDIVTANASAVMKDRMPNPRDRGRGAGTFYGLVD